MKKKMITLGMVICLGICSACGGSQDIETEPTTEQVTTEAESVAENQETEGQEIKEEEIIGEEQQQEVSETSVTDEIKAVITEGDYDKAIEMLNQVQADMEAEEYALFMSNAYLYKEDYVAAADILVEKITETDSQELKERLAYIRENTLIVETKSYDASGNYSYGNKKTYDEAGRLLKITGVDANGNESGISEYEYDENGNTIKEMHTFDDGSVAVNTRENEYQSGYILVSSIVYDEDGAIDWIEDYDNNGKMIFQTMYMDGKPFSYYKYEYDEQGRETSLEFGYQTGEVQYKNTYEYKENDGFIEKVCYDEEGNIEATIKMNRDGKVLYDDSSDMFTYEYEYNSLNDETYSCMSGDGFEIVDNFEYVYTFIGNIEE